VRTAYRSPWQNGVAERWVGSCRRDLLDHVIVLNQRHLKRLMNLPTPDHENVWETVETIDLWVAD
jgi:putative transposase